MDRSTFFIRKKYVYILSEINDNQSNGNSDYTKNALSKYLRRTTAIFDEMEKAGLIRYIILPDDKRTKYVQITDIGRIMLSKARELDKFNY